MNVMRGFTEALGVKCEFCHNTDNFASDEKIQKRTARVMIKMAANIDENYLVGPQIEKVTCFTCHRGSSVPKIGCGKVNSTIAEILSMILSFASIAVRREWSPRR